MTRRGVMALAACVAGLAPAARAQNFGSVTATAECVTVGMTITSLTNLNFGSVVKGVATTVTPTAAGAGEWGVTGNRNALVSITFTLPTVLTNIQAQPGSTMPISFSATSAIWRRDVNNPVGGGANTFNPNVGTTGRFGPSPNPSLYIWLGGTVNPAAGAKPGIYRGNVIVSLVYQ